MRLGRSLALMRWISPARAKYHSQRKERRLCELVKSRDAWKTPKGEIVPVHGSDENVMPGSRLLNRVSCAGAEIGPE